MFQLGQHVMAEPADAQTGMRSIFDGSFVSYNDDSIVASMGQALLDTHTITVSRADRLMDGEEILAKIRCGEIVCPEPVTWAKFCGLAKTWMATIPCRNTMLLRLLGDFPRPMVCAGWSNSDFAKNKRFREQLDFLEGYGLIGRVVEYFNTLDPQNWHRNERALERATLVEAFESHVYEDVSILDPDEKTWGDYLAEDVRRHDQVYKHFKHLYGVEDDGNIQEWPQSRYKTFKR